MRTSRTFSWPACLIRRSFRYCHYTHTHYIEADQYETGVYFMLRGLQWSVWETGETGLEQVIHLGKCRERGQSRERQRSVKDNNPLRPVPSLEKQLKTAPGINEWVCKRAIVCPLITLHTLHCTFCCVCSSVCLWQECVLCNYFSHS